ncbi:MAG: glycosyltransferase [Pirellulaceae bacterium]|nr:glycosyltransferase [Pirellulaceae bacterium]
MSLLASPAAADLPSRESPRAPEPLVSIVIVNTNELHHLRRCLPAIARQHYRHYEVLIVDNASTDGSLEWVAAEFPPFRIVRNEQNLGYAGANNVGFEHAEGELIAVLNPDTEVDADWLTEIVAALEANPRAGLATPKVVQMDRPDRINACGNDVTFTGLTFCRGLDRRIDEFAIPERVPAVSGAAFVIRKEVLDEIGPFDESFFVYFEDTDLSLRALLAGYECLYVPTAWVKHKYIFKLSPRKCYFQERNRYVALLRLFRWPTLLALLPALLLSEVIVWGYLLSRGPRTMWAKLRSYFAVLAALPGIVRQRGRVQSLRRVRDRDILAQFGRRLSLAQTSGPLIRVAAETIFNPLIALCAAIPRAVVWW